MTIRTALLSLLLTACGGADAGNCYELRAGLWCCPEAAQ